MCKKLFENKLCVNYAYTQKIISAFIKTLQIKLLPLSVANYFTLEVSRRSSIAPLGNEVCNAN